MRRLAQDDSPAFAPAQLEQDAVAEAPSPRFPHERLLVCFNPRVGDERHHDYALSGPLSDLRDCHVWPDLVLIYEQPDAGTLRLVCIGSHAELGL